MTLCVLEPGGYTAFCSRSNSNMLIHPARPQERACRDACSGLGGSCQAYSVSSDRHWNSTAPAFRCTLTMGTCFIATNASTGNYSDYHTLTKKSTAGGRPGLSLCAREPVIVRLSHTVSALEVSLIAYDSDTRGPVGAMRLADFTLRVNNLDEEEGLQNTARGLRSRVWDFGILDYETSGLSWQELQAAALDAYAEAQPAVSVIGSVQWATRDEEHAALSTIEVLRGEGGLGTSLSGCVRFDEPGAYTFQIWRPGEPTQWLPCSTIEPAATEC